MFYYLGQIVLPVAGQNGSFTSKGKRNLPLARSQQSIEESHMFCIKNNKKLEPTVLQDMKRFHEFCIEDSQQQQKMPQDI